MSIFNPWAEARKLREEVALLRNSLSIERSVISELRRQLDLLSPQPRDPKTGRMLPKGK